MTLLEDGREKEKAVAYYRHSAEDKQENSVPLQREQTRQFARENNIEIVHEETDEGKSGLLANRPGFQRLFDKWILNAHAPPFNYVFVLDVSRWGRFQDQDEAGHYEFICRQAGKKIIYVNQGFSSKDNHLVGSLRTSLERYMAAEYSRQLSDKVFRGAVEVTQQGFSAGGPPPYGMTRLLLNANKKPVRILKPGEHKQIANERVKFIPAKNDESETVKKIFRWFVEENVDLGKLVERLNQEAPATSSNVWNQDKVKKILKNHKYCGTLIYNKTSNRLKQGRRKNPESNWIVVERALPALIEQDTFDKAQKKLRKLTHRRTQSLNAISKARQVIRGHLRQLLSLESRSRSGNHSFPPVIFSVTRKKETREWCFVLPPPLKQQEKILAVGVRNPHSFRNQVVENWIEELFLLPQHMFNPMMFILLSEQELNFQRYRINEKTFNEAAMKIAIQQATHATLQT